MRFYGFLGLLLIVLVEINMLFQVEPFASWYVPIVWYGFILFVDGIVYGLRKRSLISNGLRSFVWILVLSVPLWSIYEFYNFVVRNWVYNEFYTLLIHVVDFTIILPAILEAWDLLFALGIFKRLRIRAFSPSLRLMILGGVLLMVLPWVVPYFFFWGMWVGVYLFLDPINFLMGNDCFIKDFRGGVLDRFISLGVAGLLCGFLWEFWNYWAVPKWFYNVPLVNFWRVFEMPLLGYLGYIPFAWSMYSMYSFIKGKRV